MKLVNQKERINIENVANIITIPSGGIDFYSVITAIEEKLIRIALNEAKNNQTKAAFILGVNRTTLVMRMRKMGLLNEEGN